MTTFESKIDEHADLLESMKDNDELNDHNYMQLYDNLRDIRDVYKEHRFISIYCIYSNVYVGELDQEVHASICEKRVCTLKVEIRPEEYPITGIQRALTGSTIPEQCVDHIEAGLVDPSNKFSLSFNMNGSEFYSIYKMEKFY